MNKKLIYGVGIDDSDYPVRKNHRVICPFFQRWKNMLSRCYSKNYHEREPTYKDCSVCEQWLTFSNFKSWMEMQDWEGKSLDKDLLKQGNNLYCPDFCLFISASVNSFYKKSKNVDLPLGVILSNNKNTTYIASFYGVGYLGRSTNAMYCHRLWQEQKLLRIKSLLEVEKDQKVKDRLKASYLMISADILAEKETKYF